MSVATKAKARRRTASKDSRNLKSGRIIMRVELRHAAKVALIGDSDKFGMTQVALLSMMIETYASMPLDVRASMVQRNSFTPQMFRKMCEYLPKAA